ncbi:MAG TPA: type II toxin-antitoxin system VapC family toxin [Gemmatimonadaceae bacterium]|nr:type II toxin-antitoxin system VapC family toxin [Gemmatimonadaceae bacterium]
MNLLDTNICIAYLRTRSAPVARRMKAAGADQLCISSLTAGELYTGAIKSKRATNLGDLDLFLMNITTVDFDLEAARAYGFLRSHLEAKGESIGPLDLLIAAHALTLGATLVTNNVREFIRVPQLRVEDWMQ